MEDRFDGLNLVQLLDLLEPVPEPPPVSWMPQTAGWIWLGIALAALILAGLRLLILHRRATAYRRAGLAALAAAGDDPARIADILRRTALAGFPRAEVANLTGADWLRFLDRTMAGDGFVSGPGRIVAEAPYRATAPDPALFRLAQRWVRRHAAPEREDA
ncbi:DUF4381 domain-containing protein [Sedimentitalea sp. JM2-8]|uniref:DUF4381 domain-containing protein n=1 Tax=Sedimentitalea xiamensis TaxID=3050037 RepID=A0ABT7FF53_9RHOB|nr:DUF4381 domain-containing protein [Sedimentitalea xiamensis]MDK3073762.1 DUF4381 domain-containing protein [Sedimentitalea xiamensis]